MSEEGPRTTVQGRREAWRGQSGFHNPTEFMMPVVIIIIVLAIAVPSCLSAWARAKAAKAAAEVRDALTAIASAEAKYFLSHGKYLLLPSTPPGRPGRPRRPWPDEHAFTELGWVPEEGSSYCSYSVTATDSAFTVQAVCDVDGDGELAAFESAHAAPGADEGITGPSGR